MAIGKISKRSVDELTKNGVKQFLWDTDLRGFGLQVTAAGAKSYIYQYRTGGRESAKRRYTIGRHGSPWTPATARTECERLALLVGQGIDPADMDRERRRQAVDLAFTAYIQTFTDGYLKSHWKDWERAERLLRREPAEVLRSKPMPQITRADIVAVLDKLTDRPAVARVAYATLRKMFSWAEGRGEIERTPISAEFPAPKSVSARDRVLDNDEIALVWEAAGVIGYPFGPMYRLLFATAARREEVAALNWSELDRESREWTLPAARAKNGQAHIIPLNDLAVEILDGLAAVPADAEKPTWPVLGLVFSTTGKTAASGHSKAKARLDAAMAKLRATESDKTGIDANVVPAWRVHDIRRTVATGLQKLGVRFEVTEAVLNHISGARSGVAGVYQRHDWKEEKRTALDAWGRDLNAVRSGVENENVIAFQRGVKL